MSNRVFPAHPPIEPQKADGFNMTGVVKYHDDGTPKERYIFLFMDSALPQLYETLGRFQADPSLSFDDRDVKDVDAQVKSIPGLA